MHPCTWPLQITKLKKTRFKPLFLYIKNMPRGKKCFIMHPNDIKQLTGHGLKVTKLHKVFKANTNDDNHPPTSEVNPKLHFTTYYNDAKQLIETRFGEITYQKKFHYKWITKLFASYVSWQNNKDLTFLNT